MSEDRFKQARRSLLDRQSQQPSGFDDEFDDEATGMVDLGSVRSGGHAQNAPPIAQPTQSPAYNQAPAPHRATAPAAPARASVVIGEPVGEGATAFIDISALAAGGPPAAVADEGSTQFININQLQSEANIHSAMSIDQDPVLNQSYAFGPESMQEGEFTLIFANDAMGRAVVLKRIWEGDVNTMPAELRQRVQMLDQIRHPRLIGLTGMFASPTGAWVELPRPAGYRLTDILAGRGPQPAELVATWVQQIAEVLTFVHQFQFVYANMTTDAIWVQDDGNIFVEPFDILTFENRGNLGVFGPPELNYPPQQRQVFPSTDVYSLAAITIAALSGLPVNLGAVAQLPKPFSDACAKAIQQNPLERIASPAEFAEAIAGKAGKAGKIAGAKGGGPNMKVLIGGVAAVGVITLGALALLTGPSEQTAPRNEVAATAAQPTTATQELAPLPDGLTVESDPRVTVVAGIRTSPVVEGSDFKSPETAEGLRKEARAALAGIDRLNDDGRRAKYKESLNKMVAAVRASELTDEDRAFLSSLSEEKLVKQLREQKLKEVQEALQNGNMGSTKTGYTGLEAIDPSASHVGFFNRNKTVKIRPLTRTDEVPTP